MVAIGKLGAHGLREAREVLVQSTQAEQLRGCCVIVGGRFAYGLIGRSGLLIVGNGLGV